MQYEETFYYEEISIAYYIIAKNFFLYREHCKTENIINFV